MNTNKGMDPMLCGFPGGSLWNTKIIADIDLPCSDSYLRLSPSDPISPAPDSLLDSPEINSSSFSDLASLWNTTPERKRIPSSRTEDDEGFSDVGSSEMDLEDDELIKENISTVSDDNMSAIDSCDDELLSGTEINHDKNFITSSEKEARKFVEQKFSEIAYVPNSRSSHKAKIEYILSLSDCKTCSVEQILNLDKKSSDSARICAKIVQNIPQRYRWECVRPEQIPCCYTIVADCKKVSCRDKPPRPMNAFMIWAQGARRLINELCPKMQNAAISEALGYCWRQKSDDFKKRFEMEKLKLRRFHDFEFPAYKYKPKTKVQKAKEKEELSLSKAKLSKAGTKRKKQCDIETLTKETNGRKGRCGRPKKIKLSQEKEQYMPTKSQLNHHLPHEQPVKMSATKPAIKDMLTLKILNDRRTKELAEAKSPPADNIQHFLGQLSPNNIAASSPVSDIFDELKDLDSLTGNTRTRDLDQPKSLTPSVYDTPANTPPIDEEDTFLQRLSPIQIQTSLPSIIPKQTPNILNSSPSPTQTPSPKPQNHALSHPIKSSSSQKCLLSPQASMPSLTAILSSGPNIIARNSSSTVGQGSRSVGPTPQRFLQLQLPTTPNNANSRFQARLSSTDVILSCVSEILDFPETKKDLNNNNNAVSFYDFNNNNNRSSFDPFTFDTNSTTNPLQALLNPKQSAFGPSKIFDFNDIDLLCPDLNVPLLSDDVMSSLMNTL